MSYSYYNVCNLLPPKRNDRARAGYKQMTSHENGSMVKFDTVVCNA